MLTDRRRPIENECLSRLRARLAQHPLGIQVVDLTLLDVHPPRAVVPAYRDVADAAEEEQERINEAEAYYANRLLRVAGEGAVRMLSAASSERGRRIDQLTTGGVSNWTLTDELWARLGGDAAASRMDLSGEAASILLTARQAAAGTTFSARGAAARFNELQAAYQAQPRLTGTQLYWQAMVDSLAGRSLTIVDPKAGGRQRLILGGLEDLQSGGLMREIESESATAGARTPSAPGASRDATRSDRPGSERSAPDSPPDNTGPAEMPGPERPQEPEQQIDR